MAKRSHHHKAYGKRNMITNRDDYLHRKGLDNLRFRYSRQVNGLRSEIDSLREEVSNLRTGSEALEMKNRDARKTIRRFKRASRGGLMLRILTPVAAVSGAYYSGILDKINGVAIPLGESVAEILQGKKVASDMLDLGQRNKHELVELYLDSIDKGVSKDYRDILKSKKTFSEIYEAVRVNLEADRRSAMKVPLPKTPQIDETRERIHQWMIERYKWIRDSDRSEVKTRNSPQYQINFNHIEKLLQAGYDKREQLESKAAELCRKIKTSELNGHKLTDSDSTKLENLCRLHNEVDGWLNSAKGLSIKEINRGTNGPIYQEVVSEAQRYEIKPYDSHIGGDIAQSAVLGTLVVGGYALGSLLHRITNPLLKPVYFLKDLYDDRIGKI